MKYIVMVLLICSVIFGQEITTEEKTFLKVAEGLSFPEGPAYDYQGSVYFSNCYSNWIGKITRFDLDTFVVAPTSPYQFSKTNGMAVYKDGSIFACDYGNGSIVRFTPNTACYPFVTSYNNQKFNRPNDIAFTPEGNIYFTDPKSYDKNILDGVVYYIDMETKEVKPAFSGLGFPNGIAIGPCQKFIYVCESAKQRVLRFKINEDRTLTDSIVVVELPGGDPGGIAFDVEGNLYIAHFGGGKIVVVSPEMKILKYIKTPGKKPSNIEFAGKDMKTIFITEDETNAVYKTKNDIAGMKLFSSPGN